MKNILLSIISLVRPQQWLKNLFVFLPIFFGSHLFEWSSFRYSLIAFFSFSFAASSIYCFNDIYDVNSDRLHPIKCKRPIAAGLISKSQGYIIMTVMLLLAIIVLSLLGKFNFLYAFAIILFYVVMNIAYCIKLKQVALLDVFVIATGFVLRVILGGVVTDIKLSHWIIMMTFLLALFLAFAKRRDDVVIYEESGIKARKNINRYNLEFLNQIISIVSAIIVVCYILYTVSEDVMSKMNTSYLYLTSIWVLLGLFRYLQITIVDIKSGSPTKVLVKDKFIQFSIVAWILTFGIIIYL